MKKSAQIFGSDDSSDDEDNHSINPILKKTKLQDVGDEADDDDEMEDRFSDMDINLAKERVYKMGPEDLYRSAEDKAYLLSLTELQREKVFAARTTEKMDEINRIEALKSTKSFNESRASTAHMISENKGVAGRKRGEAGLVGKKKSSMSLEATSKQGELSKLAKLRKDKEQSKISSRGSSAKMLYGSDATSSDTDDEDSVDIKNTRTSTGHTIKESVKSANLLKKDLSSDVHLKDEQRSAEQLHQNQLAERDQISVEDVNLCLVRRAPLEVTWLESPYTRKALLKNFVRVTIGNNEQGAVYKLTRIADIVNAEKPYFHNGKYYYKLLVLKSANGSTRKFQINYVSNSNVSPFEFEQWRREIMDPSTTTKSPIMKRDELITLFRKIAMADKIDLTKQDVEMQFKERQEMNVPFNENLATKKAKLIRQHEILTTQREDLKDKSAHGYVNDYNTKLFCIEQDICKVEDEINLVDLRLKKDKEGKNKDLAKLEKINELSMLKNKSKKVTAHTDFEAMFGLKNFDLFQKKKCRPVMSIQNTQLDADLHVNNEGTSQPSNIAVVENNGNLNMNEVPLFDPAAFLSMHDFDLGDLSFNEDYISTPLSSIAIVPSKKPDELVLFELRNLSTRSYKIKHGLL